MKLLQTSWKNCHFHVKRFFFFALDFSSVLQSFTFFYQKLVAYSVFPVWNHGNNVLITPHNEPHGFLKFNNVCVPTTNLDAKNGLQVAWNYKSNVIFHWVTFFSEFEVSSGDWRHGIQPVCSSSFLLGDPLHTDLTSSQPLSLCNLIWLYPPPSPLPPSSFVCLHPSAKEEQERIAEAKFRGSNPGEPLSVPSM